MTEILYYKNQKENTFKATVKEVNYKEGNWHVTLDKTAFFPEGGGMQADEGTINNISVINVYKHNSEIVHVLNEELLEKDIVGEINLEHRYDQAVAHTTQHLVSHLFKENFNGEADSICYNNGINEMDLIGIEKLTYDMINSIEKSANQMIVEGSPIEITIDENERRCVNIVACQDYDECGCFHVDNIIELRQVKILKWEKKKNYVRIYYTSGQQVLNLLQSNYDILQDQVKLMSRPVELLNNEIQLKIEKIKQLEYELDMLSKEYLTVVAKNICKTDTNLIIEKNSLETKKLQTLAQCLQNELNEKQLAVITNSKHLIIISSDETRPANEIFNELKTIHNLKGGGNKNLSQGGIDSDIFDTILSYIESYKK